jgi:hypothetical protein
MILFFLMLVFADGQEAAAPVPSRAAALPPRTERRICRRMQMTGTRLSRVRVCQTEAEWEGSQANWQSDLRNFQDRQTAVSYGPGGRSACPSSVPC